MTDPNDTQPPAPTTWQAPGPKLQPGAIFAPPPVPADAQYAPPPAFQPPPYTGQLMQPARLNPLALTSFILSLVPFLIWFLAPVTGLLAVIFGHVGLVQTARRGERGRGFAIAGLIIGYFTLGLGVVFLLIYLALLGSTASSSTGIYDTLAV